MIVCILFARFSILAIFIISLLLCIRISSIISIDPVNENPVISQTDSTEQDNQTVNIDEQISPLNDNIVLSDLNTDSISTKTENDIPIVSTEIVDEIISTTVSSLIADNQTHDEHSQTSSTTVKKNLSSINSFEEWKQQQLHADLLKKGEIASRNSASSETLLSSSSTNNQQISSSIGSTKKGKRRKNFASASCGAKILAHNIEAQNVASILSSSPDEYMLNPCNAKIWFVIELCESIRILNIEIANFELFSSVPKTFRVSASDRYPTKDWHRHQLGTFNASFNRTIQSFHTIQSTMYLKYVKFELVDFHGHEHYCPLSVVRIHGSNVEDEIMTMEENTNLSEMKSLTDIQDENDDDDDDNLTNEQQVGGIIGSAILDLAKRVFRRQTIRGTSSTTSIPIIETNVLKPNCHQSILNGSIANENINIWRRSEALKQCIAEFLFGLWSEFDTCTIYLSQICFKLNYCCQCPLMINNNNQIIKNTSTLNIYINPCGYYHILTNQFICKKEKLISLNKTTSTNNNNNNNNFTQDLIDKNDTMMIIDESRNSSDNQSILNLNESLSNEIPNETIINRSNDQILLNNISNETIILFELQNFSNTSNETISQSSITEPINIDFNITESSIEANNIEEIVTTSSNNNEVQPPIISSPWLKGMLVNTKSLPELFKIIEKLNFNLTLSNRYLQELSQHYVKKIDETQQTTDLLLKSSKTADKKLENLEEQFYKLQENFTIISYRLIKLEAWIPLIVCTIICLFIACIWSTCHLIHLRRKFKYLINEFEIIKTIKQTENIRNNDDDDDDDLPITCNGYKKRKLSTDSSDSNPTRSQRVPDVSLSKITENGIEYKLNEKSSNQTQQLLSLSTTIHT